MPADSEANSTKNDLQKAEKWRRQAEEFRAESKAAPNDSARRAMVLIAKFYDEMASLLETRSDPPPPNAKARKKRLRQR